MKVCSYNIQEGGNGRVAAIAELIRNLRSDAVALLEVTDPASVGLLADWMQMQIVVGESNHGYHVAWLSRLPIRRSQNHRLATLAKTLRSCCAARIEAPQLRGSNSPTSRF